MCCRSKSKGSNNNYLFFFNPLNPHDASKHNFVSLKNDLISAPNCFKNTIFHATLLIITRSFSFPTHFKSSSSTTSRELRQQFRLVVDEDDNGKFRLERVNPLPANHDYL